MPIPIRTAAPKTEQEAAPGVLMSRDVILLQVPSCQLTTLDAVERGPYSRRCIQWATKHDSMPSSLFVSMPPTRGKAGEVDSESRA